MMMFGNIVFVPAQSDSRRAHEFDVPEVFFFVLLACALVPVSRVDCLNIIPVVGCTEFLV